MKKEKHCFAVAAYGESPYLEELLQSLKQQTVSAGILLCTSTPNEYISALAEKYEIPLRVREGVPGLKEDWNFAYCCGSEEAELVTIAHQDDLYYPDYGKAVRNAFRHYPDMSVFCCRYDTINEHGERISGLAEGVKRFLRFRLRNHDRADRKNVKLSALRWGNGIGCPSCTYNTRFCEPPLFRNDYRFVIDWETLVRLAGLPGRFICIEKPLMSYRVHQGAETMVNIRNHNREREEREMFEMLHGKRMASLLMHFYRKAYGAYEK